MGGCCCGPAAGLGMSNSDGEEPATRSREEEEEFYESVDRILSSSCSSTSASDDDGDHHTRYYHGYHHRHYGQQHRREQRFLPSSIYDVWISQPLSVEERRRCLLQQMGLIGDPTLSRGMPVGEDGSGRCGEGKEEVGEGFGCGEAVGGRAACQVEMEKSVPFDGIPWRRDCLQNSSLSTMGRSRSDGAMDADSSGGYALSTPLVQKQHLHPKKPSVQMSLSSGANTADSLEDSYCGWEDGVENGYHYHVNYDLYCRIKNLDSGEEFVVRELSEDGMWNKLREVGTGRQLTMEEFQISVVGHSPIVHELMRRQNVEEAGGGENGGGKKDGSRPNGVDMGGSRLSSKRSSWLKSIKNIAGTVVQRLDRRSSGERDTSSEKGGRRSSSATDDSHEAQSHHVPERVKVRQYRKSWKELTGLYMSQKIQAHNGSIWSIKFSLDGQYLASAGEDCVIHVWLVVAFERRVEPLSDRVAAVVDGNSNTFYAFSNLSPESLSLPHILDLSNVDRKRRAMVTSSRKSFSFDQTVIPENAFSLSEKPVRSFYGHLEDVLDLSWSKSEYLLSSSMDKTVRLWHMSSNSCLKIFSHSDYVTCIQFNPVDDNYFISGSLDAKVRIWSVKDRQVVDWSDLREMVTAACYTPDGQGALLGSHKGSCLLYDTSDNKLCQKNCISLRSKGNKSHHRKITGFQFVPGSSSEVLVTTADSRIHVVDGLEVVHKFKGFRNTSSQISASLTADGKYVVCASEDSHVYVWRRDADPRQRAGKAPAGTTQSYEHFHCPDVSVAVAWPGTSLRRADGEGTGKRRTEGGSGGAGASPRASSGETQERICRPAENLGGGVCGSRFGDRVSATWPEEKLLVAARCKQSPSGSGGSRDLRAVQTTPAWGMAIVTAGRGGRIRVFQNFGYPFRI